MLATGAATLSLVRVGCAGAASLAAGWDGEGEGDEHAPAITASSMIDVVEPTSRIHPLPFSVLVTNRGQKFWFRNDLAKWRGRPR
ncbi:hypothetical protein ASG67_09480 [Sphingomonas sp. Leaf339]|nr:hypothetical protein ASG67_09480 [Sphingomonas sp. Leaf339]